MLPADTRRILSGIVRQLRDVPRAIIGDPAEVVHFLGRTARALERLRDQPVPVPIGPLPPTPRAPGSELSGPAPPGAPSLPVPPRALSSRERAEAVFRAPAVGATTGKSPAVQSTGNPGQLPPHAQPTPLSSPGPVGLSAPRTITDRKGRGVRVEARRARAAGQLEMLV